MTKMDLTQPRFARITLLDWRTGKQFEIMTTGLSAGLGRSASLMYP